MKLKWFDKDFYCFIIVFRSKLKFVHLYIYFNILNQRQIFLALINFDSVLANIA